MKSSIQTAFARCPSFCAMTERHGSTHWRNLLDTDVCKMIHWLGAAWKAVGLSLAWCSSRLPPRKKEERGRGARIDLLSRVSPPFPPSVKVLPFQSPKPLVYFPVPPPNIFFSLGTCVIVYTSVSEVCLVCMRMIRNVVKCTAQRSITTPGMPARGTEHMPQTKQSWCQEHPNALTTQSSTIFWLQPPHVSQKSSA